MHSETTSSSADLVEDELVRSLFDQHVGYSEFPDAVMQAISNSLRSNRRTPKLAIEQILKSIDRFRGGGD